MIVYRIVQSQFSEDLSGFGASIYGGRWNSKGRVALYCAQHVSLAALELVVNFNRSSSPLLQPYVLLEIDIPESFHTIKAEKLKADWMVNSDYTRFIGDNFLHEENLLTLVVPSSVIPQENNFMINPNHSLMSNVKIISSRNFGFDNRLLN